MGLVNVKHYSMKTSHSFTTETGKVECHEGGGGILRREGGGGGILRTGLES